MRRKRQSPRYFSWTPFLLLRMCRQRNKAANALPNTAANVITNASKPIEANPAMIWGLLPTSTPRRNKSKKMNPIMSFEICLNSLFRSKKPTTPPNTIKPIAINIVIRLNSYRDYSLNFRM